MEKARFTPEQRASHPVYCASLDAWDRWFDHIRYQHADCDSECREAEKLWQDQRLSPERETEIRKRLIFGLHGLPYRRIETVMLDEALQELDATRADLAQAQADVVALTAKLSALAEWTCDEGGWRLFYYSTPPPEGIFNLTDRFNPDVDPALAASHQQQPGASPAASPGPEGAEPCHVCGAPVAVICDNCLALGWLEKPISPAAVAPPRAADHD